MAIPTGADTVSYDISVPPSEPGGDPGIYFSMQGARFGTSGPEGALSIQFGTLQQRHDALQAAAEAVLAYFEGQYPSETVSAERRYTVVTQPTGDPWPTT